MDENDREYSNGDITVYWKPKECIHATTCFRELRSVFDPAKRPWVNMKGGTTEEIIRIVDLCPTDALTYKRIETSDAEEKKIVEVKEDDKETTPPVEIRVMRDGPLVVRGEFTTKGADGTMLKKMKIASFCRCGQSNNMPYCDGTHRKVGWASD